MGAILTVKRCVVWPPHRASRPSRVTFFAVFNGERKIPPDTKHANIASPARTIPDNTFPKTRAEPGAVNRRLQTWQRCAITCSPALSRKRKANGKKKGKKLASRSGVHRIACALSALLSNATKLCTGEPRPKCTLARTTSWNSKHVRFVRCMRCQRQS